MRKFKFRLQTVLEYRRGLEQNAKTLFANARAERIAAEEELARVAVRRRFVLQEGAATDSVDARLALEKFVERLDGEEQAQNSVVSVLKDEESVAQAAYIEARKDAEAIEKLRVKARAEYELETLRYEQAQLDEFAVQRRSLA